MAEFQITNNVLLKCILDPGEIAVTIPDSVTSIGEGALEGCSGLKSFCIPGYIALSALQKSFWIWDDDNYKYVAPEVSKILPKPGFLSLIHI